MQLAHYPPILPHHPWHAAEQSRLAAVDLWKQNRLPEAQAAFVQSLGQFPQFPFLYSTYHRFLHLNVAPPGLPPETIVNIPSGDPIDAFRMYRFFGRDQSAQAIAERGWQGFETPSPTLLARWLRRKSIPTFCDVGANSGYYALLAAAAGVTRTIAVEPYAPATDLLTCNVELNRWDHRIEIHQAAASDRAGTAHLYLPLQAHGLLETSASQDPTFRSSHSLEFDIPALSLDSLLADAQSLAIKIDVEGVAPTLGVLHGATQTIQRRRPVMMVEYMDGPAGELNRLLASTNYHSVICRPDGSILAATGVRAFADQPNHFLVPAELTQEFVQTISSA